MKQSTKNKIIKMLKERELKLHGYAVIDGVHVCFVRMGESDETLIKPESPTILQMVGNFTKAVSEWAASGFKVVSREVFLDRLNTCRVCEAWDEKARGGLGKCKDVKCGCTKVKHWLETSKCPRGLW